MTRTNIPEAIRREVIERSSNSCCVCQVPFIEIHHIDSNHSNNDFDNLAPLCPNHHTLCDKSTKIINKLTPKRLKQIRDHWYAYCEQRKEMVNVSGNAKLKLKNFKHDVGLPKYGWEKTFRSLDESYKDLNGDEILDMVFSTTNPDELKTRLESVKSMYQNVLIEEINKKRFKEVCNSFGIDIDL